MFLMQVLLAQIMTKIAKNDCFNGKHQFKIYFWWVFGHAWTRFFTLVNFPSTLGINNIFLGQKNWLIFHLISALFSPPSQLPKAVAAPYKFFMRVPWWNTFQSGVQLQANLEQTPKPLLAKIFSNPKFLNPQSQPSVQLSFNYLVQSLEYLLTSS